MEQSVGDVVGKVQEAIELENCCIRASTPRQSIRLKRLVGWLGVILRCIRPTSGCRPGRMRRGPPRRYGCDLVGVVICMGQPLHALLVWSRPRRSPLVNVEKLLSDPFSSLIYNFESR